MGFNHRAAAWIEDLFNGMDDDEVEIVAKALVFDVHLQDIENNRRTIDGAVERINKSILAADGREEISKAIASVTKSKDDPNTDWWDKRDEHGRFAPAVGSSGGITFLNRKTGSITEARDEKEIKGHRKNRHMVDITSALGHAGSEGNAFSNQWHKQGLDPSNNAAMYNRIEAGSRLLGAATQGNPKAQLAAQAGVWVGKFGPEAEKVIGPSLRRSTYRYRGTERRPDRSLYELKAKADKNTPVTATDQGERSEQHMTNSEMAASEYLLDRLPSTKHSGLQLASGKVPPSEGVIINSAGQIITQAVGYSDDHYLPFNLKNLKGLQGGSYVRSRTTGGLTAEDIYTGLISGARSVTVVSHSGIFTVNFDPDFRGGRRYNDKAKQMVDRYEKTLDAVKSKQVKSRNISPEERAHIRDEVETEMANWGADRAEIETEIKERTTKFLSDPTPNKEEIADIESKITAEKGSREYKVMRSRAIDQLTEAKSRNVYQLDGEGYGVALEALKEQFPYYIESAPYKHRRGGVNAAGERSAGNDALERRFVASEDRGYVTPKYIRPGAAESGYFDPTIQGEEKAGSKSGKYSAAHENYANWTNNPRRGRKPGVTAEGEAEATPGGPKASKAQTVAGNIAGLRAKAAANKSMHNMLQMASPVMTLETNRVSIPTLMQVKDYTEEELAKFIADPENRKKMENQLKIAQATLANAEGMGPAAETLKTEMKKYEAQLKMTGGESWSGLATTESPHQPFSFTGPAYTPGATLEQYEGEWKHQMSKLPKALTASADAGDDELRARATLAGAVARALKGDESAIDTVARLSNQLGSDDILTRTTRLVYNQEDSPEQVKSMIKTYTAANESLERMRRLRVNMSGAARQAGAAVPATSATPEAIAPASLNVTNSNEGYTMARRLYEHSKNDPAFDQDELKTFNAFSHAIRDNDRAEVRRIYAQLNDPQLKEYAKNIGKPLGHL